MKEQALKGKYESEIQNQKLKKFSNSSYLTPEAALYLNEAMKAGVSKIDGEIIYAGQHEASKPNLDYKNNQKFSTKYTKRRQSKRKKKGKFG
jgi:hypothetical protein